MKFTRRAVRQRRRHGVHGRLRGAAVPHRPRARAGARRRGPSSCCIWAAATTRSARWCRIATRRTTAAGRRWPCRPAACCRSAPIRRASSSACIRDSRGLKAIFDQGRLAIIQRTGYQNSSRSHFQGFDIWGTANPVVVAGHRMARPLPRHAAVAGRSARRLEHDARDAARRLMARTVGVPAITNPATYSFASPNSGNEAVLERTAATKISSHLPVDRPHLAFVNSTAQAALGTLDQSGDASPPTHRRVTYPNNGLGAGAARRRRRDEQADRHQGVLGADRRLRHARRRRAPTPARMST